jgi:lipid II:glycine glycyltransferase (peptidoglycan interpeptide bridge formation enzyme)
MASDINEMVDVQVDIGILKTQVLTLSALCNKMDVVIEKLVDQHDRHIAKVYADMDQRRLETEKDIKEIHERIDTVLDKMQDSNEKIMEEFKSLRKDMSEHNRKEKESLDKLLEWKWMLAGGIIVLSYLISHVNFDTLLHLAK